MALIRQANAARSMREAIVLDLGDLSRQGEAIKARAREEAARLVAEAKAERERLLSDAREVGRAEGYGRGLQEGRIEGEAAGKEAALAEFRERLARLEGAWLDGLRRLEAERDAMYLKAKEDVLRLAVEMGRIVTRRVIEVNPEVVGDQLRAVLERTAAATRVEVRVHPEDRAIVDRIVPEVVKRFGQSRHIEVVESSGLERGSVVATMQGTAGPAEVDASIGTQLERIIEALIPADGGEGSP
ncbi:MAG: hypothetical protein KF678_09370 [Phycisphaeraceae bacterium]|nr:hypothetical protein [Phycisphaeraceae bacterium]